MTDPVVVAIPPAALRPKEAARYLGISETTLRALPIVPIPIYPTGTRKAITLYLRADLDAYLVVEAAKRDPNIRTTSRRAS
jgi:hypothetical protein